VHPKNSKEERGEEEESKWMHATQMSLMGLKLKDGYETSLHLFVDALFFFGLNFFRIFASYKHRFTLF
jgi:hypothetical protein